MTSAKIIKHSITEWGQEIVTFELEYPRMIHAEFLVHRVIAKNSSSSRAIPVMAMIKSIWNNPAKPCYWGRNQAGMSAKEELAGWNLSAAKGIWWVAAKTNCLFSFLLSKVGAHKQIANRITEPFSHIKIVATATSWDNFFTLRIHPDAQPEIQELAREMQKVYNSSSPQVLKKGEWHLPYVESDYLNWMTQEQALKLSASLCAQTSYRKVDDSLEKADAIFGRLVESSPIHFSPTEHQGTPLDDESSILFTHKDRLGRLWSGNFCGWGQYRQQIQQEKKLEAMTCKVSEVLVDKSL